MAGIQNWDLKDDRGVPYLGRIAEALEEIARKMDGHLDNPLQNPIDNPLHDPLHIDPPVE